MGESDYAEIFREEAAELLEELESSLLELEKSPEDLKLVGRVFRAMHTIKGSGAMFGFDDIAGFTHHVETVLDEVRSGAIPVSKDLIGLILAARDHIKGLLDAGAEGASEPGRGEEIIAALKALAAAAGKDKEPAGKTRPAKAVSEKKAPAPERAPGEPMAHYRIRLKPKEAFFETGVKAEQLLSELAQLGECSVYNSGEQSQGETTTAPNPLPFWDVLLTTDAGVNAIRDVFIFVEDTCELKIVLLAQDNNDSEFPEHKRLGEILVERGDVSAQDLQRVLAQQKPIGEMLVEAKLVSRPQVESALAEQQLVRQKCAVKSGGSIRVASEKLDKLINLVGELVVTQARLTQVAAGSDRGKLLEPVEEVERLTAELRDCVLNIRMLPIGTTFGKFSRLVRDLSAELGKEIDLVTEGAETELDKTVIEQLSDPLIHLIRNSIDHGIEAPGAREAAGKPRRGYIRLAATHSGANVIITVTDDGRGLDPEKIKAKALASGIINPGEELSEREVLNLIFAAGFSMAEKVTSVSGRGVGMDVVRSAIDCLKGSVEVTGAVGRGTTVAVTLPLTLAIIDGLLVRAGVTHFVLPLTMVEECVELSGKDIERFHGRRVLPVREHLVPYVRLRDFFEMGGSRPELEQMVVVQVDGERAGIVLDDVIGGHQTVIKSLGWVYRQAQGLSGSTILGSGEVALIVDVPQLMKHALKEEAAMVGGRVRKMIH